MALSQSQRTLKSSHDLVMAKVDEQTEQLKQERLKSVNLEGQLQLQRLELRRVEEVHLTSQRVSICFHPSLTHSLCQALCASWLKGQGL